MNKPLVSIIIPVYNHEKYILETIKSVIDQAYENIEIIIIDDGSEDSSGKIVERIKDNRINYFYQKNRGVSAARNQGLKIAKGEFVAFIDSDDTWKSDKLQKEMELLLKSEAGACYCGAINYIESTNSFANARTKFLEGNILLEILKDKIYAHTSTWIIRKDILVKHNIKFVEGCNWSEDLEFFTKVTAFTRVFCVKEYLSVYRNKDGEGLSSVKLKKFGEINVLLRLKAWLMENADDKYDRETIAKVIDNFRIPFTIARILHFERFNKNFDKGFICKEYKEEISILRGYFLLYGDLYHKLKYMIFKGEFLFFS